MSKFKRKTEGGTPGISTASLPDIVFMLLFFFMVVTVMKPVDPILETIIPNANEVRKLEDRSLVSYIYIGSPFQSEQEKLGSQFRIQLNDDTYTRREIQNSNIIKKFFNDKQNKTKESKKDQIVVSIKADENVIMGIIDDVKYKLREAEAYQISYSTEKTQTQQD